MVKPHPKFSSVLKDRTQELLIKHLELKVNKITDIAIETGLSTTWIAMFARNEIVHTDVGRVTTLYNYLSPIPLSLPY